MYQALYRKWRPQTFDDVIGQEHITASLKNQVKSGHLSHAYIFIGTRGTGKTTCARILAKAVNCENPVDGNPCCVCPACRSIAGGTAMDVVELDAASNNGVDNVRALREEAVFSPSVLKKRVYIIDEVHMLSTSAFNALLKILEEPPEHLMFILATTELQKMPATILSRCQRHSFRRIERGVLADYVQQIAAKESISITPQAAGLIAGLAEGGVRDSLSMLDQCSTYGEIDTGAVYASVGLAGNSKITRLFSMISSGSTEEAVTFFSSLWMDGKDPAALLKELGGLIRDILIYKVAPGSAEGLVYGGYDAETLSALAKTADTGFLISSLDAIQAALGGIKDRLSPRITAELCLVELCRRTSDKEAAAQVYVQAPVARTPAPQMFKAAAAPKPAEPVQMKPAEAVPPAPVKAAAVIPEVQPEPVAEEPPQKPEPAEPARQGASGGEWEKIKNIVRPQLSPYNMAILDDEFRVAGRLSGDMLTVFVEKGFFLDSYSKSDVQALFARAASQVAGRDVHVKVTEKLPEAGRGRDLEELRAFPEVKFIN